MKYAQHFIVGFILLITIHACSVQPDFYLDIFDDYCTIWNDERARAQVIFCALRYKNLPALNYHVTLPFFLEARDNKGKTLLLRGIQQGTNGLVRKLLKLGADVNAADPRGNSPLHVAAHSNNYHAIRMLLEKKAKINQVNYQGHDASMTASYRGHPQVLQLLLSHEKIDSLRKDPIGNTCYELALIGQVDSRTIHDFKRYENVLDIILKLELIRERAYPSLNGESSDNEQKLKDEFFSLYSYLHRNGFKNVYGVLERVYTRLFYYFKRKAIDDEYQKEFIYRELVKEFIIVRRQQEVCSLLRYILANQALTKALYDHLIHFVAFSCQMADEEIKEFLTEIRSYLFFAYNQTKIRPPCSCLETGAALIEWEDLNDYEDHRLRDACIWIVFKIVKITFSIVARFIF